MDKLNMTISSTVSTIATVTMTTPHSLNTTQNVSTPTLPGLNQKCQFEALSRPYVIILTTAYGAVIMVSLIANIMVIHYAASRNKLRRSFDRLIVNMAAADILDAVAGIPLNIVYFYMGLKWFPGLFGELACKTINFGVNISITASGFTLVAIAVDRYFAIAHKAKRSLSRRTVKFSIFMIWITSCMVFSSDYYRFRVMEMSGQIVCLQDHSKWGNRAVQVDTVVKFVLNYGFPLAAMAILYGIIIRYLWKRKDPGYATDNIEKKIQEQRRNSVKKLMTIVTVFAVCWFPIHVMHFIAAFNVEVFYCTSIYIPLTCIWLAHSNCAINPCLYLYLSRRNRASIAKPSNTF